MGARKRGSREWYYGENTLWATGWLLWSQILLYRATEAEEALETARKSFRDLRWPNDELRRDWVVDHHGKLSRPPSI